MKKSYDAASATWVGIPPEAKATLAKTCQAGADAAVVRGLQQIVPVDFVLRLDGLGVARGCRNQGVNLPGALRTSLRFAEGGEWRNHETHHNGGDTLEEIHG